MHRSVTCLLLVTLTAGCTVGDQFSLEAMGVSPAASVELVDAPFFPQTTDLCGPAALATVLNYSGVDVGFEQIESSVYIPERGGSLQIELVGAMRKHGRVPYELDPSVTALVAELEAGRPVLVMQNLGIKLVPIWHYAVVVGYSATDREFVLRSGDVERHVMVQRKFLRSWHRAGYWAAVALRPGELPAVADERRYLAAVAALESIGQHAAAATAYRAALAQWPQSTVALLGLGNAHYSQGDLAAAERAYRDLLAFKPDYLIAQNNLAQTLADRGCVTEARALIERAVASAESTSLLDPLVATRDAITAQTAHSACGATP